MELGGGNVNELMNVNDLLGLGEDDKSSQQRLDVNIADLQPFHNHPFKLYKGKRLEDMIESIKEHGVIIPLIVRPVENGKFEILSGHNRANAGKLAGLTKLPILVKEGLTEEEAMLIVTETNLIQRAFSELAHSEKARILSERHKAIKSQGKRTDLISEIEIITSGKNSRELTSCQFGEKIKSDKEIGSDYDLSARNVARYLRIDILIDELKEKIDSNEIPFNAGVDLSFLDEGEQIIINEILNTNKYKISLKKSNFLKKLSQNKKLNKDMVYKILSGEYFKRAESKSKVKFTNKFTNNIVNRYVTEEVDIKELEDIITSLLDDYFSK